MNNFEIIFQKKINIFLFFLVSSFIMIMGINASFFLFIPVLYNTVKYSSFNLFKLNNKYKKLSLLFAVGVCLGSLNLFFENPILLSSTQSVIPNYIYWVIIIFVFTSIITRINISQFEIFRILSISVFVVTLYYLLFQNSISNAYFFKNFQKNNYAFLIITYSPYLIYYVKTKYSKSFSIIFFLLILIILLIEQRRAGFVLTLLGCSLSYFVEKIKFTSIFSFFKILLFSLLMFLLFQTSPIKKIIETSSPRIYTVLYQDVSSFDTDRSSLTRKAMIEKGLVLFSQNIFFGVGLNNFTKVEAEIKGNFIGSEFVVDKDIFERTSSHNSYINILAEGGLFLAIPFGLILFFIIKDGILYFNHLNEFEKVSFFSFIVMLIHFYFMNSVVNSLAWLNIALVSSFFLRKINQ